MAKIIFEDIKKTKSIRNIKKETISPAGKTKPKMHFIDEELAPVHKYNNTESDKTRSSKYILWVIAIVCIGALLFALSFLFVKAKITIVPKSIDAVLDQQLNLTKDDKSTDVYFSLVSIEGEEKKNFESGEAKDVSIPATGKVIIYNSYSKNSQNLDINTRLEGSNGKIYKTEKKITVPGISSDGNPGKIEVGIYATENGESYNSEPLDFKILGFKGNPKYNKIYARSVGSINGGFVGKINTLSDIEKEGAYSELGSVLKEKLSKKVADQIPEGFLLYDKAIFFDVLSENIGKGSSDTEVEVSVKGKLYGFIVNEKVLTTKIANNIIEKYNNEDIYLNNIKNLDLTILNAESITEDINNLSIKLTGNSKFVYRVDPKQVSTDLLGKNKKYFNQIMSDYLNIESANLELFPPWMSVLPDKIEKINITVNYPK